jgi:hypothetical protein
MPGASTGTGVSDSKEFAEIAVRVGGLEAHAAQREHLLQQWILLRVLLFCHSWPPVGHRARAHVVQALLLVNTVRGLDFPNISELFVLLRSANVNCPHWLIPLVRRFPEFCGSY